MSLEAYQAVSLALLVISFGTVGIRFWKLRGFTRNVHLIFSDVFYVLGFAVFLAMGGIFVFLLFKEIRIRKETDAAPKSNPMVGEMYLAIQFFSEFGYRLEVWALKFCYVTFFWGVFKRVRNKHIWIVYIVFVALICTFGAVVATLFVNCQPVSRHWTSGTDACPYKESFTTLKLATFSNIATYISLLLPPTILLVTSDYRPPRFERIFILILYIIFLIPITCPLIRYVKLFDLTTTLPISSEIFRLTTLLTMVETTALLIPLCLLSFLKAVKITPESEWNATLVLPNVSQPNSRLSGRGDSQYQKKRRSRIPLGFPSLPSRNVEFKQKQYGFDDPDLVELGDALPGVDYKVYSPDGLNANYDYIPPTPPPILSYPTPPPPPFSPAPPSSIYSTPYVSPKIGSSGYIRTPSPPDTLPPSIPHRNNSRDQDLRDIKNPSRGAASVTSQRSHRSRFEKIRDRIEQESQRSSPVSNKRGSPSSLETSTRTHMRAESAASAKSRSPTSPVYSGAMSPLSFHSPLASPTGTRPGVQSLSSPPLSPVTREARLNFYRSGGPAMS